MANRDRITELLTDYIIELGIFEANQKDGDALTTALQDTLDSFKKGYESFYKSYVAVTDILRPYLKWVGEELGYGLARYFTPTAFTILAENVTEADLKKVGIQEDLIQTFSEAQTASDRESLLELLEPAKILDLFFYAEKRDEIEAQIDANREKEKIVVTINLSIPKPKRKAIDRETIDNNIAEGFLQQIRTATPESLQGSRGLLRADMGILEQSIKREARQGTDDEQLRIVFTCEGEYPDGTKWERPLTPEKEEEVKSWAQ